MKHHASATSLKSIHSVCAQTNHEGVFIDLIHYSRRYGGIIMVRLTMQVIKLLMLNFYCRLRTPVHSVMTRQYTCEGILKYGH